MAVELKRSSRKSLTKKQLHTEIGTELLSLCQTITKDGRLSEGEVNDLAIWLEQNRRGDLPAIDYLTGVVEKVVADEKITPDEYAGIHRAIEVVLPPEIRSSARDKRKAAENQKKALNKPLASFDFMVAGVRYEGRDQIVSQHVREGDQVGLLREPENEHSDNAIEVIIHNGSQIGYLPERDAAKLAPLLDQGCKEEAHVKKILDNGKIPIPVVVVNIYRASASRGLEQPTFNTSAGDGTPDANSAPILMSVFIAIIALIALVSTCT